MRIISLPLACLLLPCVVAAQGTGTPSDTALGGVTARGRMLAEYDRAAWYATDAVMALHPDPKSVNAMLAMRQPNGHWVVHFATLTENRDSLLLHYEARESVRPDSFTVREVSPPAVLSAEELRWARALRLAGTEFGQPSRPYNNYVLPRPDGDFWVYFLPAQTDPKFFPHGADVRYRVSADCTRIVEKREMHRSLLELTSSDSAVAGFHTVITDDIPQDSDVFLVLTRTPRLPEIVATEHYLYEIAIDGTITWKRR